MANSIYSYAVYLDNNLIERITVPADYDNVNICNLLKQRPYAYAGETKYKKMRSIMIDKDKKVIRIFSNSGKSLLSQKSNK
jgi:hypothetical protein